MYVPLVHQSLKTSFLWALQMVGDPPKWNENTKYAVRCWDYPGTFVVEEFIFERLLAHSPRLVIPQKPTVLCPIALWGSELRVATSLLCGFDKP